MSSKIGAVFSENALIKDSFIESNELFGDIIEKLAVDHDTGASLEGTGRHNKVTLTPLAESETPTPVSGEAILYRSSPLELTLAELNEKTKEVNRKVIANTIPGLPLAYSSFSITNGTVTISYGENVQEIVPTGGRSIFTVTFVQPLSSAAYRVTGWAVAPTDQTVFIRTREKTPQGFRADFTNSEGAGYTTLQLINFSAFF